MYIFIFIEKLYCVYIEKYYLYLKNIFQLH